MAKLILIEYHPQHEIKGMWFIFCKIRDVCQSLKSPVDHDIVEIKNWFTENEKQKYIFHIKKWTKI